ncbi:MAG: hypothetical protein GTO02_04285 [Candidatus Dadabacteria bacterium]|nr:hypothetical protein [Candidatus Dadabacteria bacterium]
MIISNFLNNHNSRWMSIELAANSPTEQNISLMKKTNKIILSTRQLKFISKTIINKEKCKLLVFGVGNDSGYWHKLNRHGVTVFLEDNEKWIEKVKKRHKSIKVYKVDYKTKRKDWKELLDSPDLEKIKLPDKVVNKKWDVILVDAPEGWSDNKPGRMKSIFLSSKLVKISGDVFVHDCNRQVEDIYSNKFLKKRNLKIEIKSFFGNLRHYQINRTLYG